MYSNLLKTLKDAVDAGDKDVVSGLKSLILSQYKGSHVLSDVNEIIGKQSLQRKTSLKKPLTFSVDDFNPDKKKVIPTPSIEFVATDETTSQVGNMWKSILEKTDDELKLKFNKDITVAIEFLNQCRKELGLELFGQDEFKSFSASFFKAFRATLSLKINK
jgi:hypothetical protein